MKNFISLIAIVVVAGVLLGSRNISKYDQPQTFFPEKVKKVIDDKCYGCHSIKGKSQKAKDKLMWDSLPNLEKKGLVSKFDGILEVLDENSMPPEEFLKKFPEAKLLPEEKSVLKTWADSKADSLLK
jgi:hypothetical protein